MKPGFLKKQNIEKLLSGIIEFISDKEIKIIDQDKLKDDLIDKLIYEVVFNPDKETADFCSFLIKLIALEKQIILASIHNYYKLKAKDERKITIPAINIRGMAYNTAQAVFKAAKQEKVNAFILEIAKSEIKYTEQRPAEYTACMLAAAIKEDYQGSLFLQGDHFQIDAEKYKENPVEEREKIKQLINEAIAAGFYQIDLDMSTLVDWSEKDYHAQQKNNYQETAELTAHVRNLERELGLDKQGIIINLGGEIGEIGKGIKEGRNSIVEDLRAFMDGYLKELARLSEARGYQLEGITKIAIQTGTCHGGIRDEKGNVIKEVKLSFNALAELGQVARKEYGLAGVVQHGASTLDPNYFGIFAGQSASLGSEISEELLTKENAQVLSLNPVAEVHLATAYQDTILDHPEFPKKLIKEIKEWVLKSYPAEQGEDSEKAYKSNRKRAWGKFKLQVWSLPFEVQESIQKTLNNQFSQDVFKNLGVQNFNIQEYI
jgi:hypothetical protein